MYKVNGDLTSCDITYSGRVPSREGDIHSFALSLLLNGLSKSAQTFTVGFVTLLSTHPIHIVVSGNFPFDFERLRLRRLSFNTPVTECFNSLPIFVFEIEYYTLKNKRVNQHLKRAEE